MIPSKRLVGTSLRDATENRPRIATTKGMAMDSTARETTGRDTPSGRQRILDAAAHLFRRNGFNRTTVRELAEASGMLSGSLFHHFQSKDDILFQVMQTVIEDLDRDAAAAIATAATPADQLRALVRTQLAYIHGPRSDATTVLVYEWNALSPDRQALLLKRRQDYFARWQQVLDTLHDRGATRISDPTMLRNLVHGALVWSANWFDPSGTSSMDALENAVVSLVLS